MHCSANGSATISFYLDTDSIVGGDGKSGPLTRRSAQVHDSPASGVRLDLLLVPLGLLGAFALRRRMPRLPLLLANCVLLAALTLNLCGGNHVNTMPSTAPGTYVIPITATGANTQITHTAN